MNKRITWLLDPGHGGIGPKGLYLTKGKRSPSVPPGIYEGEFNLAIAERLKRLLQDAGYSAVEIIRQGAVNINLNDRINFANQVHKELGNCIYVSLHANAQSLPWKKWGTACGPVIFYHPGSETGTRLAKEIGAHLDLIKGLESNRSDTLKKSRWLKVIRKTKMPAILIEFGFMTHEGNAKFMASEDGRDELSDYTCRGIGSFSRING